ncbi:MAG: hypothetical protein FD167_4408 [bacterium]|nr:MAG: hypothetical protein FD167_4408 [bacterium]
MFCCHTNVPVRADDPKVCAICGDDKWWDRENQGTYKPRKNSIKLYCDDDRCKKEYYVSPGVYNKKLKYAETVKLATEDSRTSDSISVTIKAKAIKK